MTAYKISLKGTKKENTQDLTVIITCNSKNQSFNLAYAFFQQGRTNVIYGTERTGLSTIHRWLNNAENLREYAG